MLKTKSDYILFTLVSFILLLTIITMGPEISMNDPDTFWHIELGRYMLENKVILDHAIHTFDSNLPYVPHEIGFQLIVGFLYNLGGWGAVYISTAITIILTIWGMFELAKLSKRELGLKSAINPSLVLVIMIVAALMFILFFHIRPQNFSAPIIIWFFIWMRRFQNNNSWKSIFILTLLSLLLANIHTGVWMVIFVFYGMLFLESLFKKTLNHKHWITYFLIIVAGLLNPGGLDTLLYFMQVGEYNHLLVEWQPISVTEHFYIFILLLLFVWSLQYSMKNNIFRIMFMTGIFFLGLASYKQFLYLMLFLPYFLSPAFDNLKFLSKFTQQKWMLNIKYLISIFIIGFGINIIIGFTDEDVKPDKETLPVEEMDFILKDYEGDRPKVLAEYGASGYIMFSGGDILSDGRYDPFVSEESKKEEIYNWSSFERNYNAFQGDFMLEVLQVDKPDYLILPIKEDLNNIDFQKKDIVVQDVIIYIKELQKELGEPDYVGSYGMVYDISEYLSKK